MLFVDQQGDGDLVNKNNNNEKSTGFSKFYIIHFNIRSMRSNFNSLLVNLSSFSIVPDIIFLTEIWINESEASLYKIPGYMFFICGNVKSRAGGVAAFVKNNFTVNSFNYNTLTADCMEINISLCDILVNCLCVYRHHCHSIENYVNEIIPILNKHRNSKNFLLIGDINIDILASNSAIDNYMMTMSSYGLNSLINEHTRIVNVSRSCIDHAYYRFRSKNISINGGLVNLQVSDHIPILLSIKIDSPDYQNRTSNNPNSTFINQVTLNSLLQNQAWLDVFSMTSVNDSMDSFVNIFQTCLESCKSQKKNNPICNKIAPWMSYDLYLKVNLKNKLYKKLIKHPTNSKLIARFKRIKKNCTTRIKSERASYYRNLFKNCSKDSKKQWQLVNAIIGEETGPKKEVSSIIDDHGNFITNPLDICNLFNSHFTSASKGALQTRIQVARSPAVNCYVKWQNESFRFNQITPEELLCTISDLNNKKSGGYDGINSTILKQTALSIVYILSYIFNRSVIYGIFPDVLKFAKVIPLYKKDNRLHMTNYRPISQLSIFSKVFEKLIKSRMISYLDNLNFLSDCQYGFRRGRSTEDALLAFLSPIYNSLNNGKIVGVLFLDISKAFDTVNHGLLLNKLWRIGFRGFMYNWLKSYLQNRFQHVQIGVHTSSFNKILSGVPQGSVLGPLLFLIYINSFFDLDLCGKVVAFADDLALTYCVDSLDELERQMNSDLVKSRIWFTNHQMNLSSKSRGMLFNVGFKNFRSLNVYYHNDDCTELRDSTNCLKLEFVQEFKYLGITIDSKLNFKPHIKNVKI